MHKPLSALLVLTFLLTATAASAQFSSTRGVNAPEAAPVTVDYLGKDGVKHRKTVMKPVEADKWGNAAGTQYDLAVDGAFEGQTVAVLQFYTLENFDFALPKAALKEKGFSVYRWKGAAPSVAELEAGLKKSCQLWIIASDQRFLTDAHLDVIKKFFDEGHGVYVWGDNDPYYADANAVAQKLFGGSMTGNLAGGVTVPVRKGKKTVGIAPNHDLTTGIANLFEGITIATLHPNDALEPLVCGLRPTETN